MILFSLSNLIHQAICIKVPFDIYVINNGLMTANICLHLHFKP